MSEQEINDIGFMYNLALIFLFLGLGLGFWTGDARWSAVGIGACMVTGFLGAYIKDRKTRSG